MSLNKKIKNKSDKSLNIPDSDSPLLDKKTTIDKR